MKLKSMICSAAFFAICGLPVLAQDGPPPEGGSDEHRGGPPKITAEGLKTELKLTDEQVKKLQALLDKVNAERANMRKEMMALRESGEPMDHDAMKAKMDAARKKMTDIVAPAKEFLSADQFKTLTDKLNKRPKGPRGGPGGPPPAPSGDDTPPTPPADAPDGN